ncbi:unnamed protein product [Phaeothamnion confervicola]
MKATIFTLLLGLSLQAAVSAQPSATLELTSVPSQALIFLDRTMQGKGHVVLSVPAGKHLLRVAAGDDFEPYTREIDLTPDQPTRLKIQLAPSARRWIQSGRTLLEQGDAAQAQTYFARSEVRMPVESSWWQGIALWKLGRSQEAVPHFRKYAQYVTDAPELYLFLGLLHAQGGRSGEAFTAYKTALLQPTVLGPAVLQNLPEATFDSIKAMGKPSKVEDKVRLAQLYMLKGMKPEALSTIQSAVSDKFGNWTARDWAKFDPKVPPAKVEEVAPPEDVQK